MFQKFGLVKAPKNQKAKGRFNVTGNKQDMYVFKVPLLRNVELTAPYFHDGSVWSLQEAISIMAEVQVGQILKEDEVNAIEAFLKTLTGDQPKVKTPHLPPRVAKTQRPNTTF